MNVPLPVLVALAVAPLGPLLVAPQRAWRALLVLGYLWPIPLALRVMHAFGVVDIFALRRALGIAILEFEPRLANEPETEENNE